MENELRVANTAELLDIHRLSGHAPEAVVTRQLASIAAHTHQPVESGEVAVSEVAESTEANPSGQ